MYIYTPLCRYWIALYRYVLVFIVPRVDIELEDNKQFISNIPRMLYPLSNKVDSKTVSPGTKFLPYRVDPFQMGTKIIFKELSPLKLYQFP